MSSRLGTFQCSTSFLQQEGRSQSWKSTCSNLRPFTTASCILSVVSGLQVEFDANGKAYGVTSEGETAKCKKVVCDPSYLSEKVTSNNNLFFCPCIFGSCLRIQVRKCLTPMINTFHISASLFCGTELLWKRMQITGKEGWKSCACCMHNEPPHSGHK